MKKISVILIGVLLCLISVNVFAYSDSKFTMSVPDEYEFTDIGKDTNGVQTYLFSKEDGTNATVAIVPHNAGVADNSFSENYIKAQVEAIEEMYSDTYSSTITVLDTHITTMGVNDYKAFFMSIKVDEYGLYQQLYTTTSNNYAYTLTFTSLDEDYFSSEDVNLMESSFELKDEVAGEIEQVVTNNMFGIMLAVYVGIFIIGIITAVIVLTHYLKKSKKKKAANIMSSDVTINTENKVVNEEKKEDSQKDEDTLKSDDIIDKNEEDNKKEKE